MENGFFGEKDPATHPRILGVHSRFFRAANWIGFEFHNGLHLDAKIS
jgi:hypothetical protein